MDKDFKQHLMDRMQWWLERIEEIGGYVRKLKFAEPASETDIIKVENELGFKIPPDFREFLFYISADIECIWSLYDEEKDLLKDIPGELNGIFAGQIYSGQIYFGLNDLAKLEQSRKGWIEDCYSDPNNPYDRVYHHKFCFQEIGNGDFIAIDLNPETYGDIVYISHDGDAMHGYILAHSFSEFLEHWSKLGFVGGECWELEPFTNNMTTTLDSECENAKTWIDFIKNL